MQQTKLLVFLAFFLSSVFSSNLRTPEDTTGFTFDLAKHLPINQIEGNKTEIQAFVDHINHLVNRAGKDLIHNFNGGVLHEAPPPNISPICSGCHFVMDFLASIKKVILSDVGKAIIVEVCSFIEPKNVCAGLIEDIGSAYIEAAFDRLFSAKRNCPFLGFCAPYYIPWTFDKFIGDLLKDKPKNATLPRPTYRASYRIAHISDIHIDSKYQEGTSVEHINDTVGCRHGKGEAGPWGTPSCDSPQRNVEAIADYIANNLNIDMLLWTGDNIAHDIWDQKRETQTLPTKIAAGIINERLHKVKKTPVIPIFGNHECFPLDTYDFYSDRQDTWRDELGEAYKDLFEDPAPMEEFKKKGFYSYRNSTLNLKVMALNTMAGDIMNPFVVSDPTDPGKMLQWLIDELTESEAKNEFVWIIGHIPPGALNCYMGWSKRYNAIIERFAHVVRGQFFGHTHHDHFEIQRSVVDNSIVGVVNIVPSVTGLRSYYPSIRVYEIDTDTGLVVNHETHRLDSLKSKETAIFFKGYDFLSEYGFKYMDFTTYDALAEKMRENVTLAAKVVTNVLAGRPVNTSNLTTATRDTYCFFQSPTYAQYWNCYGVDSSYFGYLANIILELLCGEWNLRPRGELAQTAEKI